MKAKDIQAHEKRFADTLTDSGGVKYTREIVKVDDIEIHKIRPDFDTYYTKTETDKTLIVVHHSEGYLKGDIDTLVNDNSTLSVSYVISRGGIIYELFDPKYWAWHLGKGSVGGNQFNSKRSIAIELSNAGVLKENGNMLEDYGSPYCSKDETDEYIELDAPFRGEKYFASIPDEQYKALGGLIKYLCKTYKIPKQYLPVGKRYELFASSSEAKEFNGICSHINFRASGKWDVGPAFDWNKLKALAVNKRTPIQETTEMTLDEVVVEADEELVVEQPETKKEGLFELILNLIVSLFGKKG